MCVHESSTRRVVSSWFLFVFVVFSCSPPWGWCVWGGGGPHISVSFYAIYASMLSTICYLLPAIYYLLSTTCYLLSTV